MREREGGGGVRANLDAAGGGTYLIFPLVKLILGRPFLIIIAQSLKYKIATKMATMFGDDTGLQQRCPH